MMMRGILIVAAIAAVSFPAAAQRRTTPTRTFPKPKVDVNLKQPKPYLVPEEDWRRLATALKNENWTVASNMAKADLELVQIENEKRQLAQLRYIRMYALSGQILRLYEVGRNTDAEALWSELDGVVAQNIGKEIIMPARFYADDCSKKLNYLCRVKGAADELRTTATDSGGTGIHSFEYVKFDNPVPPISDGAKLFVGGTLSNAEYNDEPEKPWVLRLFVKSGFVAESLP